MRKPLLLLIPLLLANLFCTLSAPQAVPASPSPDLALIVSSTLTAEAASHPSPVPTVAALTAISAPAATAAATLPPIAETGVIMGEELMFPADAMPALRIAFFDMNKKLVTSVDTAPGQRSYSFNVPPGTYFVVAYAIGGNGFTAGTAGGYTQAVPCGLSATCTDHSLVPVAVKAGDKLLGINPNDYYAPDGTFPPMPK